MSSRLALATEGKSRLEASLGCRVRYCLQTNQTNRKTELRCTLLRSSCGPDLSITGEQDGGPERAAVGCMKAVTGRERW